MYSNSNKLYKHRPTIISDQKYRRDINLNRQQEQRDLLITTFRNLMSPLLLSNESTNNNDNTNVDSISCTYSNPYENKLMLSEWFVDIPNDLSEKWLMLLCPKGKRCLLITRKNKTFLYSKHGKYLYSFECPIFPGGSRQGNPLKNTTTLDCIYDRINSSLYILDVILWNGLHFVDCYAEMRLFFIQSRINDYLQVGIGGGYNNNKNHLKFGHINIYPLPKPCINLSQHVISMYLNEYSTLPYQIDGLLFYHKHSFYYCGERVPLVGWLKIPMLSSILNVSNIPSIFFESCCGLPSNSNPDDIKLWLMNENEKLYSSNNHNLAGNFE